MANTILAISGSLRARSSNTEVLRAAALVAPAPIDVKVYDRLGLLPHFNPDLDIEGATLPDPVQDLRAQIRSAAALLICSPEYAHGVPGTLKNALDWLVSAPEMVYKRVGLLNISPRSTYAYASLAETLKTMSTVLVPGACVDMAIGDRRLEAAQIAADPALAPQLQSVLEALVQ